MGLFDSINPWFDFDGNGEITPDEAALGFMIMQQSMEDDEDEDDNE